MKKFALTATVLATAAIMNVAHAADLPTKAPVNKAAAPSWTGFYVNGGLGYGFWTADTSTQDPATGACGVCVIEAQGGQGWLGVAGVGYDYQFTGNIVAGVSADYNVSHLKGTIQDPRALLAGHTTQSSAWAAGARAGWLFTPELLGYVNGGYSRARFSGADMVDTFDGHNTGFLTPSFTAHGWFLGGGTETALAPHWFWRIEYRYAHYGNQTLSDTSATFAFSDINFKPAVQTVTTQIAYKFNDGNSALARPAAAAPVNWTGFAVSGGVGYGAWTADTTTIHEDNVHVPVDGTCHLCEVQVQGGQGWLGRAGLGFDYQFGSRLVAGAFVDFDLSSLKGTIQDQNSFLTGDLKQIAAWAFGGRVGGLLTPQILGYANGGYGAARFSGATMVRSFSDTPISTTASFSTHGWFAGGGVEAAIAPHVFWRNEYRYAIYADRTLPDIGGGDAHDDITFKPVVQTVTTQLVYKFN